MRVKIPFSPKFKEPMLNGTKTMTSRSKKYGEKGDVFEAFGTSFEIINVYRLALGDIASFWKKEGFRSLKDFENFWIRLHPKRPYRLEDRFYVHEFRRLTGKWRITQWF